ncbi:MAG: DUF4920 domain-containing protein [Flavobacteriales bacterium CG_4_9_14_0_2_um_filter_32_27]|nr:MAG: DUF4920 domain-containing protein [Flavobacteriales bacterium CG_4_9_14_0_2_um_filter_32_27]
MKKIFFLASTIVFFACNNVEQNQNQEVVEDVEVVITKHGEDISEEGAITTAEFLTQFEGKDSLYTKLIAPINEVCAKKGCWMTINLGEDKEMRVRFKDYDFFVPKDAAGKFAIVQGFAKIDTTSIDELKHYLQDAEASQEEIDAITEPEINYSFEAEGVIIKEEKLISNEKK